MSQTQSPSPSVQFTAEQMLDLIREMRKPADPTPEEAAKKAAELQRRKELAQLVDQKNKNREREQEICTHLRREDGSARTVYVQNGNFIICQECQKIMRPETNLQEFNRFFILSGATRTTF